MIKKYCDSIKRNKILIFFLILLVIDLLIVTTTFEYNDFTLQLPFNTLFGNISYGVVILFSIVFYFIISSKKEIKIENLFISIAIPIGILYCMANPLGKVPDEDFQARKVLAMSQGNVFSHADENGRAVEYENSKILELVTRTVSSYEEAINRINMEQSEITLEVEYNTMALYSPICHLPQTMGVLFMKIFTKDIVWQFYSGRIANLIFAVFIIYFAIKYIPIKKNVVAFLGLLPITLNEFASLSADAITISMCIFYISYILYLAYGNIEKYSRKNLIVLIISSIIVSLIKIVYVPLVLLLFVLPKDRFLNGKQKNIIEFLTMIVCFVINIAWLIYCSRFLVEFNPGVNSIEQIKYVLTNPIAYIFILIRTTIIYLQNFIVCLNGEGLGHYNAQASVLYVFSSVILSNFLFFINDKREKEIIISIKERIIYTIIFILIVLLIYTSLYVQWNIVGSQIIVGVQGRYFLPVILLTVLVMFNNKFRINIEFDSKYLFIFMLFFNLNALGNICFTYLSGHPIEYLIK